MMRNGEEGDHGEPIFGSGNFQDPWADPGTSGRARGRGRGRGRARGGRSQRSVGAVGSKSRAKTADMGQFGGRPRGGSRGGRKRGRRGVRTKPQKMAKIANDVDQDFVFEESPVVGFQEWNAEETADLRVTENASSSEYEMENDNNGQASVDEYDDDILVDDGYRNVYDDDVASRGYIGEFGLEGEEEYVGEEDDVEDEEDEEEDEQGGVDVDGFFNDDSDENRDVVGGGQIGNNPDDETESSSSGYSD